jgi:uncharacterized protein (TIGR02598 family)
LDPSRGFSLIEVVLALGVVAFAIVGIMGLFPVALRTAQESQRETRATFIARQLWAELQASPSTNARIAVGANPTVPGSFVGNSLFSNWSVRVGFDEAGRPLGTDAPVGSIYSAVVTNTPNTPTAGLARIEVQVQAPAQADETNRTAYSFVGLMRL